MREDRRKHFSMGTRGSVEVDAETDEPQTKARGREFQRIVGETMVEARAMVEERLRAAGYGDLRVKIRDADIDYGFDADIVEWRD